MFAGTFYQPGARFPFWPAFCDHLSNSACYGYTRGKCAQWRDKGHIFTDPTDAMAISLEKFLYMNRTMGDRYSAKQVNAIAQELGLSTEAVAEAQTRLRRRLAQIKPSVA